MKTPKILGISGESGVGKSTIAEIISLYFGIHNVLTISTDDLHKWERTNKNWEHITHLNPNANNLELGDLHLQDLSNGKYIYRSKYNHKTGYFDPPTKLYPKDIIIVEGLHAFHTDASKELINLKIFVDTDDELRTHWKIIRDTEERGYKYNVVLDNIHKRKLDNDKIREAQIKISDVIICISPKCKVQCLGDKNEKIDLELSIIYCKNNIDKEIFGFIQNYFSYFNEFIKASEELGENLEMCQDGGGNISVKVSDKYMLIKSSGFNMKDTYKFNGYSIIDYQNIDYDNTIESISNKYKKPSMEAGFHAFLDKYVIHIHPIYLTLLLCLKNSKEIINNLYNKYSYQYIEYTNPGSSLLQKIKSVRKSNIYFLENHGLIISDDNIEMAKFILISITNIAKDFLKVTYQIPDFNSLFNDSINDHYLFPDAVVFLNNILKKEIKAANNYINIIGNKIGQLRYLSSCDISYLKNLESEKYRQTL